MRLIFAAAFLSCFVPCAIAQISIQSSDLPTSGSSYGVANAAVLDADYTIGGANQTWDFSDLTPLSEETVTFGSVSSAPFTYQFLFNNPFDQAHQATHTIQGDGIDLGFVSIDEFYFFYKNTPTEYNIVGYGGTVSGIPIPSQTDPIDVVYALPVEFENAHTSTSAWSVDIPTLGSYDQFQVRTYTADGWGMVTTPAGTFEALRVRMVTLTEDSLFIEALGNGVTFEREAIAYQWLTVEGGIPVLEITESFGAATARYRLADLPDAVENPSGREAVNLQPTLCTTHFEVQGNASDQPVLLYTLSGQLVRNYGKANGRFDVFGLPAGCYLVVLREQGLPVTRKITVQP